MKKVGGRCLATHGWNAEDICCFPLSAFYLLLLEYASTPTVCWLGGAVGHCSLLFPSWREGGGVQSRLGHLEVPSLEEYLAGRQEDRKLLKLIHFDTLS